MPDPPIRYLRQRDAARYCGICVSMLLKLVAKGQGPRCIRKGRAVLYDIRELDAWMQRDQEQMPRAA